MNNIIVSIHASTREATNLRGNIILFLYWFQSTPPRGRRLTTILIILTWQLFQSTPPRGRRPLPCHLQQIALIRFNPRLHAGGDAIRCPSTTRKFLFQSTPPRGRRRASSPPVHQSLARFNPRLHAGGDLSILRTTIQVNRFNPRLHAGGDISSTGVILMDWLFQSTPPRGRRLALDPNNGYSGGVSIHASTREATLTWQLNIASVLFQSTPPRGRRLVIFSFMLNCYKFQSTPPRGRRRTRYHP